MKINKKHLLRLILIVFAVISLEVAAADYNWEQLSPSVQNVLKPFAGQWQGFDAEARERLVKGADRWVNMTPDEKQKAKKQFGAWQELPADRKQDIRQRFDRFRDLTPEQQRKMKRSFDAFKQLPRHEREALKKRFSKMTTREKKAFLEGAALASGKRGKRENGIPRNKRPPIPPEEKEQFRALVKSLDKDVKRIMLRTMTELPPEERSSFRKNLYAMTEQQRREWLLELPSK